MTDIADALKRNWHWAAAACLLAFQTAMMALFIAASSPTIDEPIHLAGGINNLKNADFSLNPESGVLIQDWSALPNLGLKFPQVKDFASDVHNAYALRIHPAIKAAGVDKVYARSRCMIALLNIACGLFVFHVALRVAGRLPAVLAYGLYCSMPVLISNGALITADMGVTFAFFLCCFAFWRLCGRVSVGTFALAAAAAAILAMCKYSCALMAPAVVIMAVVKCMSSAPLHVSLPFIASFDVAGLLKRALLTFAIFVFVGLFAFCAIWAAYGFRYSQNPPDGPVARALPLDVLLIDNLPSKTAYAAMKLHLFPEAYLYGFLYTNATVQQRFSFLNGEISMTGFKSFFPQAFLMKTPPGAVIAFAIGLAALLYGLRSSMGRRRALLLTPYLAFAAVYLAVALGSKLNIGVRHLLPAMPALVLLAALGFRALLRMKSGRLIPPLLVAWCVMETLLASPHQLAYFSSLYGGPDKAYTHLVDSSLDWGQDLKSLRGALERANVKTDGSEKIYFCYFGSVKAEECGFKIDVLPLPMSGQFMSGRRDLEPGAYCLSATALQGVNLPYTDLRILKDPAALDKVANSFRLLQRLEAKGSIDEIRKAVEAPGSTVIADCYQYELLRFELLRRHLLQMEPFASAGHSILVYKVSSDDLAQALGPVFSSKSMKP